MPDTGDYEILKAQVARLKGALRPFAFYHKERLRLHPGQEAVMADSTIPDLTYGEAKIGDKHFRAADAALSDTDGGWLSPEAMEQATEAIEAAIGDWLRDYWNRPLREETLGKLRAARDTLKEKRDG